MTRVLHLASILLTKKLCLFKLCLRRNGKLHTKGSDFPTSCKQEKVQSNKFFCSSKNTWVTLSSGRKCSLPCSSSPDSENVLMEDFYLWRWDFLGHVMRGKALFNKKKKTVRYGRIDIKIWLCRLSSCTS